MNAWCKALLVGLAALLVLGWGHDARSHFQVLLPSHDVVGVDDGKTVDLTILFTHPMEQGPVMEMGRPRRFGMLAAGKHHDLMDSLRRRSIDGKTAYTATARLLRPADYVFYLEPAPYWEPVEQKMIVHYTKVVVDYLGGEEGWDQMVGFPVEIEPLVRPYGLWAGNTFRGIVKRNGQPVPYATIEVEYYNEGRQVAIPNDAFVTQVIKADAQGQFSYTMPRAGWWGFAALVDGDAKMPNPEGQPVDVELGALLWVKTVEMK
jgi:cobalt/nickel transport protein